jgi:hypothetical protein
MSTTPTPTTGFNWQALLPVIELAGNTIVSILVPGGAAFQPLITGLENAFNPLIASIGTHQTPQNEIMIIYGTIIGALTIAKQQPGLPQATLTLIDNYITAAQSGTAAYLQAQTGYNPALLTPVTPIA